MAESRENTGTREDDNDSETKQLFPLAVPSYVALLTEPMASIADLYFVRHIGALRVVAVGVSNAACNTACFSFAGLT